MRKMSLASGFLQSVRRVRKLLRVVRTDISGRKRSHTINNSDISVSAHSMAAPHTLPNRGVGVEIPVA